MINELACDSRWNLTDGCKAHNDAFCDCDVPQQPLTYEAVSERIVMPTLTECMQRRIEARVLRRTIEASVDAVFDRLETPAIMADGYALVSKVGALAMFVSIGSLAALARVL